MRQKIAKEFYEKSLIDETAFHSLIEKEETRPFSLYNQIRTFLYSGVSLLATGLGVLIYKNIDSIGHVAVVTAIALLSTGCLTYCFLKSPGFSREKILSPNTGFDYVLLLGSLALVTLIGYLQFQFSVFGDYYGMATFIPSIILFFLAYRFDHLGVLSMAIVLFASWFGIALTPTRFFSDNSFSNQHFVYTAIGFSFLLSGIAWSHHHFKLKKHFIFTYSNFAAHTGCVAALAGLFVNGYIFIYIPVLTVLVFFCWRYAFYENSFYFILIALLYAYIGINYLLFNFVFWNLGNIGGLYLALIWLIFSAIMLIRYMRELKKKIKENVVQ